MEKMKLKGKIIIILLLIVICISISFNVYFLATKDTSVEELTRQKIDIRLDTYLTEEQIAETIKDIKQIQYIRGVRNLGQGILIIELTDISKYKEVKTEIMKINGINHISE